MTEGCHLQGHERGQGQQDMLCCDSLHQRLLTSSSNHQGKFTPELPKEGVGH